MFDELNYSQRYINDPNIYPIIYRFLNTYTYSGFKKIMRDLDKEDINKVNNYLSIQRSRGQHKIYNHIVSLKELGTSVEALNKCLSLS